MALLETTRPIHRKPGTPEEIRVNGEWKKGTEEERNRSKVFLLPQRVGRRNTIKKKEKADTENSA